MSGPPTACHLPSPQALTPCTECSSLSFLHVGHLKELLVNRYFADKCSGHLLLRFDDLRPRSEEGEFVDDIIADLGAIDVRVDRVVRATDHLEDMIHYARQLIQMGCAYMDDTPLEEVSRVCRRLAEAHARRRS